MEELMSTEKKKESSVSWARIFLRKKVISNVHKKPFNLATMTCLEWIPVLTLYSIGYF